MKISINKIIPNPQQPRKEFDETSLAELANSIKLHGLINPITVEEAGDHYILIAGERRWRAAQIAGMEDIEATVRPGLNGNGAQERLLLAITENLHREDMNVIETAQAYKNMLDMGFSVQDIALTISKNPGTINRYLSMLDFPKEIVDLYKSGQLKNETNSIAALKGIKDKPLQVKVAQSAARNNMSSPAITRFIKRMSFKTNKRSHEKIEQKKTWESHWNMIAQAGLDINSLALDLRSAAEATCKECPLYEDASKRNCQDCPGVSLLKKLCEAKHE